MTRKVPHDGVFRLLIMCTANQCRSPMAEVMARERLDTAGVDAEVVSGGMLPGGVRAARGAERTVRGRGLDLAAHTSRQVDADTLAAADLVLTMERRHVVWVAGELLEAVSRTFTVPELARLALEVGPRPAGTSTQDWIEAAHRRRDPSGVLSLSTDDDVDDPMGGHDRLFRRTADELDDMLAVIIDALFAPA